MRHELKYFLLGAITTGLIATGMFALAPLSSQADQHEQAAQNGNPGGGHPGDRKPPKRLPRDTKDLDGSIVVAIAPDGETTEYVGVGTGAPTPVDWATLGKIQIDRVQNVRGTDMVIIEYTASPGTNVICKWVGGDYKCYNT